jgi:MoxR-like ATPase
MEELEEIVSDYLKANNTDYAILIKGPWGCGKTYFFKESLIPLAKQMGFKPIYVSLYGLNDTKKISENVFFQIIPLLGSGPGRKFTEIIKVAASAFNINTGKFKANTWLKLDDKMLLCFDDLERADLELKVVLGSLLSKINEF